MKCTIEGNTIEGTPTEIHDYLLLLQPTVKKHKSTPKETVKKRRYVMPAERKKHLSDVMKMRWRVLKQATKARKV